MPLRVALEEQGVTDIDLLKIDVEGHEMTALRSMDWSNRPKVVVCEFDETKAVADGPSHKSVRNHLETVGYEHIATSEWFPVVEYGQHHRPRRLSSSASEVQTNAWGNVVAFADHASMEKFIESGTPLITRSRRTQPLTKHASSVVRAMRRLG